MSPDANSRSRSQSRDATPRVSFIIPLFNCLTLTQAMLASLRPTVPRGLNYEIILVDDGSTDGTRAWLATLDDPWVRVLMNDRNLGFAAANNRATAIAQGELFVLLNNDLVLLPGWLEPLLAAHRHLGARAGLVGNIQLDAGTGVVDHVGIVFDVKAKPEHDRQAPSRLASLLFPVRKVPAVTAACVLIASSLWRDLGGFDEGYHNGGEDVDLCFRARATGRVNAVALRSVIKHHISASAGRKLRDESNSERLARRWRTEFVTCAARHWCCDYVDAILADPRQFPPSLALRLWLYTHRLRSTAPQEAIDALNRAIDLEFVRWAKLPR
jgi:O-antigen biosynthesis protein